MSMLKPCPKCGSKRYIVWENDYWFSCRDCGWSTGVHKTMDDAIKAWNGARYVLVRVRDLLGEQSTVDSEQGEGNG